METQRALLEQLHLMGKAYGQKPSSWLLADQSTSSTADALRALDLDLAVWTIGIGCEAELIRLRNG